MRTIEEVYGGFENNEFVKKMLDLGIDAAQKLKLRRTEIIKSKDWVNNPYLNKIIKDINFWETIVQDAKDYLHLK